MKQEFINTYSHIRQKHFAFTLAEVLITLAVIGIVAALTMPTLIQSYKKQAASTRLKKFYSSMSQAIKLSEIDNGPAENWTREAPAYDNVANSEDEDVKNEALTTDRKNVKTFYNTYIKPYLRVANEDFEYQTENEPNKLILIYLSDGSTCALSNGGCADLVFDINGIKSPNAFGRDKFRFLICANASAPSDWGFNDNQKLKPYAERSKVTSNGSISREKLLQQCKENPLNCSGLLMYDNWEFKEDYPYKL